MKSKIIEKLDRQHKYRYQRLALWTMVGLSLATIFLAGAGVIPPRYPHVIVTEMIVLASLLVLKISWLIYNRR